MRNKAAEQYLEDFLYHGTDVKMLGNLFSGSRVFSELALKNLRGLEGSQKNLRRIPRMLELLTSESEVL